MTEEERLIEIGTLAVAIDNLDGDPDTRKENVRRYYRLIAQQHAANHEKKQAGSASPDAPPAQPAVQSYTRKEES